MKKNFLFTGFYFLASIVSYSQNNNAFAVQVKIENGIIEGNYDTKSGIQTYFGVPFAKPPVGELRWKAPQTLDNWKGVKETKKFGPRPMQTVVPRSPNPEPRPPTQLSVTQSLWKYLHAWD